MVVSTVGVVSVSDFLIKSATITLANSNQLIVYYKQAVEGIPTFQLLVAQQSQSATIQGAWTAYIVVIVICVVMGSCCVISCILCAIRCRRMRV